MRGATALLMLMTAWVVPGANASAADGPGVVFDEASFLANNDIEVTQRFDTPEVFPFDQRKITIDDVNYESTDTADPYWRTTSGVLIRAFTGPEDGPGGPDSDDIDIVLTFGVDQAVDAIGFDLVTGVREAVPFEFLVVEADGTDTTFPVEVTPADDTVYAGFTSDIGIVSVTINEATNRISSNFALDNVSRSALADPTPVAATTVEYEVQATRLDEDHARLVLDGVIRLRSDLQVRTVGAEIKLMDADLWWDPVSGMPIGSPTTFTIEPVPTLNPAVYTFTTTIDLANASSDDPPATPLYVFDPVVATIVIDTDLVDTSTPGPTFRQAGDTIEIPIFVPDTGIIGTVTRKETGLPEAGIAVDVFERAQNGGRGGFLGKAITNSNGRYHHDVEPGCYVLTFIAPVGDHFLNHRVDPGYRYLNQPLCLGAQDQPRTVDVTILADASVNAAVSGRTAFEDGTPVGAVSVHLFLPRDPEPRNPFWPGQYLGSSRTDDDGVYRHDLSAGCYVLTFVAPSGELFVSGSRYLRRFVCVDDAEQLGDIDATLIQGGGPSA